MVISLPPFLPLPVTVGMPIWLLAAAVPVFVFWASDLLAALLCGLTASAVVGSLPLLFAHDAGMQLQGCIPLLALALPLLGREHRPPRAGRPQALVRGVLADLETFTRRAPREDDVTVLAARMPE
jgi:hypothetical protein